MAHPLCISRELQPNGPLCLCRFLHSLAAARCSGWNPGLCVWSHVHGYQHTSVRAHTAQKYAVCCLSDVSHKMSLDWFTESEVRCCSSTRTAISADKQRKIKYKEE